MILLLINNYYYKNQMSSHNEKFFENDDGVYFKSGYPSQWYETSFIINDITYNCCEKYMMAEKARYFGDTITEELIMNTNDPKEHKKLGRTVKNFDSDKWNDVADDVVYIANLAKFSQNQDLKNKLLATGGKMFVECSPYDCIWGNGMNISDTLKTSIENYKGTNRLGLAIMKVRNTLRTN
jgi:ribA/ribD-fused uncharacterized protein